MAPPPRPPLSPPHGDLPLLGLVHQAVASHITDVLGHWALMALHTWPNHSFCHSGRVSLLLPCLYYQMFQTQRKSFRLEKKRQKEQPWPQHCEILTPCHICFRYLPLRNKTLQIQLNPHVPLSDGIAIPPFPEITTLLDVVSLIFHACPIWPIPKNIYT